MASDAFKLEFIAVCGEHLIDPRIAIENENIQAAIRAEDMELIRKILGEEF